jgi:hypothetical protein
MARKAEKIAHEARLNCERWREHFKFNIDQYHEMHTFVLGQQWTQDEEDDMIKTFRKVPMTANKLGVLNNTLLGEQRQNTPQLEIIPMTNCDEQTAQLRDLIVKDIMFSTDATIAYQVAASQASVGGFGAFAIITKYTHGRSFDLDISYIYFKDATRTFFDLGAEHPNKIDGMFCGYITRMTRPKFKEIYGKELEEKISKTMSPTQSKEDIALAVQPSEGDDPFTWADNEAVTILDYFVRRYKKDTIYKLSNGRSVNQEELDKIIEESLKINKRNEFNRMQEMALNQAMGEMQQQNPQANMQTTMQGQNTEQQQQNIPQMPQQEESISESEEELTTLWCDGEPIRIEDSRPEKLSKIMHYKIAGDYILEEADFPSEDLPIIFLDNQSYYDKNGKQMCKSFFGDCRDTQRYINYIRTQSAYILKVSRYDQFMGSKKNVQSLDTQRNWRDPNSTQGLIAFDESPTGVIPTQLRPPELSQSLTQQYELAIQDLYLSTGLYPSRMGQTSNEISGDAIDARARQGSFATAIFFNSINRAISAGGQIVNQMIPKVYDSERVIALMMPDEGMQNITINKQADEYGELIENDIRKGTYEVRLKAGASYEGQKELALKSLQQVIQADPQTFSLIADLYAENLPLSNSLEIKNRLKTIVPPQIIEAGKTGKMPQEKGQGQPSPEEQAMQMQQQQMQMEMQFKQQEIEIKKQELQLKAQQQQIDLEIEKQKLMAEELEVAGKIEEQKLRFIAESGRTESDASIAHANNLVKILTHKIQ